MMDRFLLLTLSIREIAAFSQCSHRHQTFRRAKNTELHSFMDRQKMLNDPSYSDNFLLSFHNQAQDEKMTETNSLSVWNEELAKEQASVKEWQDSFQRNNLADFTPPMSAGLNCLMVGAPEEDGTKLPWEDEAEATVTPLRIPEEATKVVLDMVPIMNHNSNTDDGAIVVLSDSTNTKAKHMLPAPNDISVASGSKKETTASNRATLSKASQTPAASYDCIVDNGLLDAVVALKDKKAVQDLLLEAATAIRELGIYVYIAKEPLSAETKHVLEETSELAGLEWEFELDGLFENGEFVSVARRYNNGLLPSVGKLSRFQV